MFRKLIVAALLTCATAISAYANTIVTPNSINSPVVSPAFGTVAATGYVTNEYQQFGLIFGSTAIFNDGVLAWGGISETGHIDLVSPITAYFVLPNTTTQTTTNYLSVEVGYAAIGSLTLDVFDANGVLLGSTTNGPNLGPHERTLATISADGISSFRVSGNDTWGMDQVEFGALSNPADTVPEPGTLMLLGAGFLGLAIYSKRRRQI